MNRNRSRNRNRNCIVFLLLLEVAIVYSNPFELNQINNGITYQVEDTTEPVFSDKMKNEVIEEEPIIFDISTQVAKFIMYFIKKYCNNSDKVSHLENLLATKGIAGIFNTNGAGQIQPNYAYFENNQQNQPNLNVAIKPQQSKPNQFVFSKEYKVPGQFNFDYEPDYASHPDEYGIKDNEYSLPEYDYQIIGNKPKNDKSGFFTEIVKYLEDPKEVALPPKHDTVMHTTENVKIIQHFEPLDDKRRKNQNTGFSWSQPGNEASTPSFFTKFTEYINKANDPKGQGKQEPGFFNKMVQYLDQATMSTTTQQPQPSQPAQPGMIVQHTEVPQSTESDFFTNMIHYLDEPRQTSQAPGISEQPEQPKQPEQPEYETVTHTQEPQKKESGFFSKVIKFLEDPEQIPQQGYQYPQPQQQQPQPQEYPHPQQVQVQEIVMQSSPPPQRKEPGLFDNFIQYLEPQEIEVSALQPIPQQQPQQYPQPQQYQEIIMHSPPAPQNKEPGLFDSFINYLEPEQTQAPAPQQYPQPQHHEIIKQKPPPPPQIKQPSLFDNFIKYLEPEETEAPAQQNQNWDWSSFTQKYEVQSEQPPQMEVQHQPAQPEFQWSFGNQPNQPNQPIQPNQPNQPNQPTGWMEIKTEEPMMMFEKQHPAQPGMSWSQITRPVQEKPIQQEPVTEFSWFFQKQPDVISTQRAFNYQEHTAQPPQIYEYEYKMPQQHKIEEHTIKYEAIPQQPEQPQQPQQPQHPQIQLQVQPQQPQIYEYKVPQHTIKYETIPQQPQMYEYKVPGSVIQHQEHQEPQMPQHTMQTIQSKPEMSSYPVPSHQEPQMHEYKIPYTVQNPNFQPIQPQTHTIQYEGQPQTHTIQYEGQPQTHTIQYEGQPQIHTIQYEGQPQIHEYQIPHQYTVHHTNPVPRTQNQNPFESQTQTHEYEITQHTVHYEYIPTTSGPTDPHYIDKIYNQYMTEINKIEQHQPQYQQYMGEPKFTQFIGNVGRMKHILNDWKNGGNFYDNNKIQYVTHQMTDISNDNIKLLENEDPDMNARRTFDGPEKLTEYLKDPQNKESFKTLDPVLQNVINQYMVGQKDNNTDRNMYLYLYTLKDQMEKYKQLFNNMDWLDRELEKLGQNPGVIPDQEEIKHWYEHFTKVYLKGDLRHLDQPLSENSKLFLTLLNVPSYKITKILLYKIVDVMEKLIHDNPEFEGIRAYVGEQDNIDKTLFYNNLMKYAVAPRNAIAHLQKYENEAVGNRRTFSEPEIQTEPPTTTEVEPEEEEATTQPPIHIRPIETHKNIFRAFLMGDDDDNEEEDK